MRNIFSVIFTISLLFFAVSSLKYSDPTNPLWPPFFSSEFVEAYTSQGPFRTSGNYWYDSQRNAQRVDRGNGIHDPICGTVLPNVSTYCTQLTRDSKRYVFYPEKRLCCVCCDAAHGCGILKRDWLSTSKYEGFQELSGQTFDKWSIPDGSAMDYYWATVDKKQIPRKMKEGSQITKEFLMISYTENKAIDLIYALPSYCTDKLCPSTSKCGLFR